MGNPNQLDLGGMTIVCTDIVLASTPGGSQTSLSATEIAALDGVTAGTATASKAVVLGASKEISTITTATITNLTSTTVTPTTIAGAANFTGTPTFAAGITVTGGITATTTIAATTALSAGTTLAVTGNSTLTGTLITTPDIRTGAGAVSLTAMSTRITSTGADALTLADGVNGQIKTIVMGTDGGDATLTPTTKTGYSTIVFNDVGDGVTLQFFTTIGWIVVGSFGVTIS